MPDPGERPAGDGTELQLDQLPVPACVTDAAGALVACNRLALELFGPALQLGQLPPGTERAANEPRADRRQIELERPDGTRLTLVDFISTFDAGQLHLFLDVSDRRRVEEALKASEERYQQMVRANPSMIYTCDAKGQMTYVSESWYAYTGLTPETAGDWLTLVVHPDDRERRVRSWAEAQRNGTAFEMELRIRGRDGSYRWFVSRAVPVKNAGGEVVQWVGSRTDIDDRKRSEATMHFLAEASSELSKLGDIDATLERIARLAVPFFSDWCDVTMLDGSGGIRRVAVHHSDPARTIEGEELARRFPPVEGRGSRRVLRTGEPLLVPRLTDAMLEEAAQSEEHLAMLKRLGLVSFMCVPIRSRSRILGAIAFANAESGRFFTGNDLVAAHDLARRAAVAIENAELMQALRETDRRKDEFLAVLAHELRNPLAPVKNAIHIARSMERAQPQLQWAHDVIDRQVQQLSRLVDDLLDVSRISSGKIELRKDRVRLDEIIATAVEASRPLIERNRHELTVRVPAEPIHLSADATRIAQVLSNLLNNAAKYTDAGGHVWLAVERFADQVAIRVGDTGIGIPHEMLPRIFDMFTQVDRGVEKAQGGLGIGLTLVKRLVEMHGGTVNVSSDGPGRGSEFTVRLPILGEDAQPRPAEDGEATAIPSRKSRILVVDDNKDAADSLSMLLRAYGHDVSVAYDGLEAVGSAVAFRPDAVLMDIGLPKLYGYDAARRIRDALGSGVLLIAVTGWGQDEDRRKSRDAGFDHHLTKPVDFNDLLGIIARHPR